MDGQMEGHTDEKLVFPALKVLITKQEKYNLYTDS